MSDTSTLHPYLRPLHELFLENGHPATAHGQAAYMKGRFRFLGISAPERRRLIRVHVEGHGPPTMDELPSIVRCAWSAKEREMHYAGMELFGRHVKRMDPSWLTLAEEIILQHSWWDTVDYIAVKIVGPILLRHPDHLQDLARRWMDSDERWLQRTVLIMQLQWKERTHEQLLFQNCAELAHHKDPFIRKAIGWALRQYARTRPDAVRWFVANHQFSPLSVREALKHL